MIALLAMVLSHHVEAAAERIRGLVRETPVEPSPALGENTCRAWLKLENLQRTGSFKLRGATNKLLCLSSDQRARGVVAASSGNHGAGVACAASAIGCDAVVWVPETAPDHKIEAIKALGAQVNRHGSDCVITETAARAWADERGMTYVSPYNDLEVVAGQGTVAVELQRQLEHVDAVFVALGGGGLISGIGTYLKAHRPDVEVIACSPAHSPVMHACLEAGHIVELEAEQTLSDATAGGVEAGAVTFELCQRVVDRSVVVSEEAIANALRLVLEHHHTLIEGAAAVAVAGFLQERARLAGRDAAIVLCGANIGRDALRSVL